jgi:hypothetical protein
MKEDNYFDIDYGRRLADIITHINIKYLDEFERAATQDEVERGHISMKMMNIQTRWREDIYDTCLGMMKHLNQTVFVLRSIASDALSMMPITIKEITKTTQQD